MTTSSPESEPHVKHTITANGIRQGHTRGLVLSQLHIGLAVGFVIVVCLTAFGGGVIMGMWYKASEQIAPSGATVTSSTPETPSQSRDATSQPQEPVTFYNTLTNSNVAYAPLTPPPTPAPSGAAEGTKAAAVAHPGKATSGAGTTRTAAGNESHKQTKAAPASKAPPAAATIPSGNAKVAANKPVAPARQPGRDIGAQRPAQIAAVATAKATSAEDFSARGQPSAVSEQGLRYRVRVGNFADRTAADYTAHHLTAQEQVPAIVAGKE